MTPLRSNRGPISVPAEKVHALDTAFQALKTEYASVTQPLTEAERRQLLGLGIANEAFVRGYLDLLAAHPEVVPATMHPADTLRDWQAREDLKTRHQALVDLTKQVEDTMARLESDCLAASLAGYQIVIRGATPTGLDAAVAVLREHWTRRVELKKQTIAAKKRVAELEAQVAGPSPAGASATVPDAAAPTTPASGAVIPMSPGADAAASPRIALAA